MDVFTISASSAASISAKPGRAGKDKAGIELDQRGTGADFGKRGIGGIDHPHPNQRQFALRGEISSQRVERCERAAGLKTRRPRRHASLAATPSRD